MLAFSALPAAASNTGGNGGNGGIINFVGRIVAPPYEIQVTPSVAASPMQLASVSGAEITLSNNSGQSARVHADSLDGKLLDVRCVRVAPKLADHCNFGPRGGTLSFAVKAGADGLAARGAILTVAYD